MRVTFGADGVTLRDRYHSQDVTVTTTALGIADQGMKSPVHTGTENAYLTVASSAK
jgi:hypothetical protein